MKVKINKNLILENVILEDGPWDKKKRAEIQAEVNMDNHISKILQERPGHYFLNPFVPGPLTHGVVKLGKGIDNIKYTVMKDNDSPEAPTQANVIADPNKGVWNSTHDVASKNLENLATSYDNIKAEYPLHGLYNPFTPGGGSVASMRILKGYQDAIRSVYSPTSAAGDTIVQAETVKPRPAQ